MQLLTKNTAVESSGVTDSSSFRISFNAKAFRVLSDTLYQDKIGSIVREISCNAYDSHIMKGIPEVPFEIHLPDAFEPYFSVKDFGIGLSKEDVKTVFTVYFESTKDNSNDTIGAFGLGSKSAFSYTDQFTVTSIKSGIRSIYSMYITESGIPDCAEMFSEPTEEQSGVEVKMSVKKEDYSKFADAVKTQLQYFKTKPSLLNTGISFLEPKVLLEVEDAVIQEKKSWNGSFVVVQGNVGYPLNIQNIRGKQEIEREVLDFIEQSEKHFVTAVTFPIGSIGVTASREGLEYNHQTLLNINSKVKQVKQSIIAGINKELSSIPLLWDKSIAVLQNSLFRTYSDIPQRFELKSLTTDPVTGLAGTGIFECHRSVSRLVTKGFHQISPGEKVVVVIKDKSTRISQKIKQLKEKYNAVYVYTRNNDSYPDTLTEEISKVLGGLTNIIKASAIELPKVITTRSKSKVSNFWQYNNTYSIRNWNKKTEDITAMGEFCYVEVCNLEASAEDNELIEKYRLLQRLDTAVIPLIAVRKTEKLDSNAISLRQYIQDKQKSHANSPFILSQQRLDTIIKLINQTGHNEHNFMVSAVDSNLNLKGLPDYMKVLASLIKMKKRLQKRLEGKHLRYIRDFVGVPSGDSKQMQVKCDTIQALGEKFNQQYPMFKPSTDAWRNPINPSHLIDYLKFIPVAV